MSTHEYKTAVAKAAITYIEDHRIIGVGTGSTANYFINELAKVKHRIDACVASSVITEARLREQGIPVIDLNVADEVTIYFDGADEVNAHRQLIKGGGGALTREKIIASVAHQFICLVDASKLVTQFGAFPIAVEVLPMARSFVAREIVKLGGDPHYRDGFITDNGNIILDIYHFDVNALDTLEDTLNLIPGVLENGLFTRRIPDKILAAVNNDADQIRVKVI